MPPLLHRPFVEILAPLRLKRRVVDVLGGARRTLEVLVPCLSTRHGQLCEPHQPPRGACRRMRLKAPKEQQQQCLRRPLAYWSLGPYLQQRFSSVSSTKCWSHSWYCPRDWHPPRLWHGKPGARSRHTSGFISFLISPSTRTINVQKQIWVGTLACQL